MKNCKSKLMNSIKYLSFSAGEIINGYLYASASMCNDIFKVDLKSFELEHLACVAGHKKNEFRIHKTSFLYDKKVFFVERDLRKMDILDTATEQFCSVENPYYIEGGNNFVSCVVKVRTKIYIIPQDSGVNLLYYDLVNGTFSCIENWDRCFIEQCKVPPYIYLRTAVYNDIIYLTIGFEYVLMYDCNRECISGWKKYEAQISGICVYGDSLLYTLVDQDFILVYNPHTEETKQIRISGDETERFLGDLQVIEHGILIFPFLNKHRIYFLKEDWTTVELPLPSDFEYVERFWDGTYFFNVKKEGEDTYLFPERGNHTLVWRESMQKFYMYPFLLSDYYSLDWGYAIWGFPMIEQRLDVYGYAGEDDDLNLELFIEYVKNGGEKLSRKSRI